MEQTHKTWTKRCSSATVKLDNIFRLMTGGPHSDCKARFAYREEGHQPHKEAPVQAFPSFAREMEVEEKGESKII